MPDPVRFVPSRVEGLAFVEWAVVYPDRLELGTNGGVRRVAFVDIAEWPWPKTIRRKLFQLGLRAGWLPVADRDWFHAPADRFFLFYTEPRMKIFMPTNEDSEWDKSIFVRIKQTIEVGGFSTCDLG